MAEYAQVGGEVGFLKLQDFWFSLTDEDRVTLHRYHDSGVGASPGGLTKETIIYSSLTVGQFFNTYAGWAIREKRYDFAEMLLRYAEERTTSLVDLHYTCNLRISLHYKQRGLVSDAIEKAKLYCLKDIKLFPRYKKPLIAAVGTLPQCPAFQQLAIIYEKEGTICKAIAVCEQAIAFGLSDGTKGDFTGRLEKLRKKLVLSDHAGAPQRKGSIK